MTQVVSDVIKIIKEKPYIKVFLIIGVLCFLSTVLYYTGKMVGAFVAQL